MTQRRPIKATNKTVDSNEEVRVSAEHSRPPQGVLSSNIRFVLSDEASYDPSERPSHMILKNGNVVSISIDADGLAGLVLYKIKIRRLYALLIGRNICYRDKVREYSRVKGSPSYNQFVKVAFDAS